MPLNTPVAFFIFNRPELTKRVFAAIAKAAPQDLLVVADGPRENYPDDLARVQATRAVIERVDWPCTVRTRYSTENLGCQSSFVNGLRWIFTTVSEAIILEDDCLPDPSFFRYCQELLQRYEDDDRIVGISGDNFQGGIRRTPYSYYFSKYFHVWGWASWSRVWKHYDAQMSSWPEYRARGTLRDVHDSPAERYYWQRVFDRVYHGHIDTWDYAWLFSAWLRNGLTILPEVNLVANTGFGEQSTHTGDAASPLANLRTRPIGSLRHPPQIERTLDADRYSFESLYYRETMARRFRRFIHQLSSPFLNSGRRKAVWSDIQEYRPRIS